MLQEKLFAFEPQNQHNNEKSKFKRMKIKYTKIASLETAPNLKTITGQKEPPEFDLQLH